MLFVLTWAVPVQAKTYYLCVGIADYPGVHNDLVLSAQDALTMQQIYQKNSVSEGYCLTNEFATRTAIVKSFEVLCAKATQEDCIVFFFSGHGVNDALCAYDGDLSYQSLYNALAQTKASQKMLFIDACLSGQMRQDVVGYKPTEAQKQTDIMFFLSSRSHEYSFEDKRLKNGYFTLFLERGLRGGADKNRNRVITAKELFGFVSQGVKTATYGRQNPVMWGRFPDTMPVMTW